MTLNTMGNMENLNKVNFWDEIQKKYPDAFAHFSQWIDDYKKEVGWDELFSNDPNTDNYNTKFHDIPFEMQNGILARYELEEFNGGHGNGKEHYEMIAAKYKQQIKGVFLDVQNRIVKRSNSNK